MCLSEIRQNLNRKPCLIFIQAIEDSLVKLAIDKCNESATAYISNGFVGVHHRAFQARVRSYFSFAC